MLFSCFNQPIRIQLPYYTGEMMWFLGYSSNAPCPFFSNYTEYSEPKQTSLKIKSRLFNFVIHTPRAYWFNRISFFFVELRYLSLFYLKYSQLLRFID